MKTDEVQVTAERECHAKIKALEDNIRQLQNQVAVLVEQAAAIDDQGRAKYKVDASDEKPELVMAELTNEWIGLKEEEWAWHHSEHRTIPVERNPRLAQEALNWLKSRGEILEHVKRIYFHEKHGWVGVYSKRWCD